VVFLLKRKYCPKRGARGGHAAAISLAVIALGLLLTSQSWGQLSMLHAGGLNVVNTSGKVVPLRGVNLGGWFIIEKWMSPLTSDTEPDTYTVMQTLNSRFGVSVQQSLINSYQQHWITTTDLDNIQSLGFNLIRVPVWYGQFYDLNNISNSGWRADAFDELDWVVSNAGQRGIYTIIDMHGVVGGQSRSDDTGRAGQNLYWTDSNAQGNTAWMWWKIAEHYHGNSNVAGYDLINEPMHAPNTSAVWTAFNNLYNSVRSADPDHMVIMEGTFGNWNWSMLPPPSQFGWTNVMYEMHSYCWNCSAAQIEASADNQVTDFRNHASYNVPGYIGEFNDFGTGSAVWQHSVNAFNSAGLSWSPWTYKAAHGLNPDSWGFYNPQSWPPKPNISTDPEATIQDDWAQWDTAVSFSFNDTLGITGGMNGTLSTSAWYNVVNANSGSCADDAKWGTANGSIVQQWVCGTQQFNQEWQLQATDSGYYRVVNRHAPTLVWDVTNVSTSPGAKIQLWTYGGGANQQWQPQPLGNNEYQIVNRNSGLCLNVPSASTANGVQLNQQTCNGTGAQAWKFNQQP
jgi:aryl-phospho-beta-D-glucosidase BglC (GH1 family)